MNIAEYLINKIKDLGVDDIFCTAGEYNCDVLEIAEKDEAINLICCTNALNAGFAADGYARIKKYGVLITNYGAEELSALSALAGSCAENVPVIHIVITPSAAVLKNKELIPYGNAHGHIDTVKLYAKSASFLTRDNAKIEIDKAIKTLIKHKAPVYIAIPEDVAKLTIVDKTPNYEWQSDPETLNKAVERIVHKIMISERPIIIADSLIERFDSKIEFIEFVEKTGIPVTNFIEGLNSVPRDSETYLGTYFSEIANPAANGYINTTDCAISVGLMYGEKNTCGMKLPFENNFQIAIYGTYSYIDGEKFDNIKMSEVLSKVTKLLDFHKYETKPADIGYEKPSAPEGKLSAKYLYPRMQEFLQDTDIIFVESGSITLPSVYMRLPNKAKIYTQAVWNANGWATPAAFGACIACKDKKVVLITGDGSHLVSLTEISSMLRYNVKPTIIVLNNSGHTLNKLISSKLNEFNNILNIDYAKLVRSFEGEIWATKVETADDFDKALRVTKIMNKLCYIEAILSENDVSSITQKFADNIRKNKTTLIENINKSNKTQNTKTENDTKLTLTNTHDLNFETHTHKSLVEIESNGENQ